MPDLLPCPFCGSSDVRIEHSQEGDPVLHHAFVRCWSSCAARGPFLHARDEPGKDEAAFRAEFEWQVAQLWNRAARHRDKLRGLGGDAPLDEGGRT